MPTQSMPTPQMQPKTFEEACTLVQELAGRQDWHGMTRLVLDGGWLTLENVVETLEVPRSTVHRWWTGTTAPSPRSMTLFADKLIGAMRKHRMAA